MIVQISLKTNGKVVARVPVIFLTANYHPSLDELINEGWRAAVEDGFVDPGGKSEYNFEIFEA